MPGDKEKKRFFSAYYIALGCAVVLGFACRVYKVGVGGIGIDESIATVFSADPRLLLQSVRPPVYYLFLAAWRWVFSDALIALRLPSVLAGVASILLIAGVATKLSGRRTGIIAAFVLACLPLHIHLSRQADVSALSLMLMLAAIYCLIRMSEKDSSQMSAAILAGLNVIGIFTCYTYLLAIIAQVMALVFTRKSRLILRRDIAVGLAAPLAALMPASPLLYTQFKILRLQLSGFPSMFKLLDAPWSLWINDMIMGAPWTYVSFGEYVSIVLSAVGVIMFVAGTAACVADRNTGGMVVAAMFYATAIFLLAASLFIPVMSPITIAHFVPFYALIISCGLSLLKKASIPAAVLLAGAVALGVFLNAGRYDAEGPAWEKAAEFNKLADNLSERYSPGDNIIVCPGWIAGAIRYHLGRRVKSDPGTARYSLPITEAPFDFYNPESDLSEKLEIPEAPRSWVVVWRGYSSYSLDRYFTESGYRLSHSVDYWQLKMSLYRFVAIDKDKDKQDLETLGVN